MMDEHGALDFTAEAEQRRNGSVGRAHAVNGLLQPSGVVRRSR